MLFLVISLMCWAPTEGGCNETEVSISGNNRVLSAGQSFTLSCKFTCLKPQHVAQLWKKTEQQDSVSLVNMSSILIDVIVVLSVSSATKADTGKYSCKTNPPNTISTEVSVRVVDNLPTSTINMPSSPQCDHIQQQSSEAGLMGQMWYWVLLGKATIFLLILAAVVVKYKRG